MGELRVAALGSEVRLDIEDLGLLAAISDLWRDLAAAPSTPNDPARPVVHNVRVAGCEPWVVTPAAPAERTREYQSLQEAVSAVCAAINEPLATLSPVLAAHAAVVARDGKALVLPGLSGAGKTTLTIALLQQGWRYVTDEALALDWETGAVQAYPRPLGVSAWTAAELGIAGGVAGQREQFVRAPSIGADIEAGPVEIANVVLLDRDGTPPTLGPAHRMDALEMLMRRSFTTHRDASRALTLLADAVRAARVRDLRYGDPRIAAELITSECT